MQISIGNLGAVLGTQLYRTNTSPRYVLGHSFALGYLVANVCVVSGLWMYLGKINRRRDAIGAERHGKGEVVNEGEGFQGDGDVRWRFVV